MNLAEMRARFQLVLAGLADSEDDASIDERLNGAYQFSVASQLDGDLVEGEWDVETVAGTGEYAYPDTVAQVLQIAPMLDSDEHLGYSTRPEDFWAAFERTGGPERRPTAALFYGRVMYLRPVPDDAYDVKVFVRTQPSALSSSGLTNRDHALAVVYTAAGEFALDVEDMDTAKQLYARADEKIQALRVTSLHSRSMSYRARRSF